jgi:hypothetical protein
MYMSCGQNVATNHSTHVIMQHEGFTSFMACTCIRRIHSHRCSLLPLSEQVTDKQLRLCHKLRYLYLSSIFLYCYIVLCYWHVACNENPSLTS